MKKLLLILLLSFGFTASSYAESVYVQYRGNVSLNGFYCEYTRSSFVDRICYQQQNYYVLVSLNGAYYHYCGVPYNAVYDWLNSYSKGNFYNSYIRGRFDCRNNTNSSPTLADMYRGVGESFGKVLTGILDSQ